MKLWQLFHELYGGCDSLEKYIFIQKLCQELKKDAEINLQIVKQILSMSIQPHPQNTTLSNNLTLPLPRVFLIQSPEF